jgi:hypothetical protein
MSRAGARPTDGRGRSAPAQPTGADPAAAAPSAAVEPATGPSTASESATGPSTSVTGPSAASESADGPVAGPVAGSVSVAGSVAGAEAAGGGASPWAGWEPVVKVGGVLVSVVFALVSAVFEVLLSTLRAGDFVSVWRGDPVGSGGGPLIPLAVVLAVAGNLGVAWFAVSVTGRRRSIAAPWVLWTVVMLVAAGVRTHEGDYLLSGTNYVALAMILIGSLTFAVYVYRLILKRIPPAAGSTSGRPRN